MPGRALLSRCRTSERFACYVLNTLLGGGMSSRLFQNIRERQGLAYAVFSELSPYRDTGCLSIYAGTSIESARKVVESILKEFRELKQDLIGEEELRRAKDHLKGSLMLSLESTSSRMSNLARQEMYFGRFFSLDELVESIEGVTADGCAAHRAGVLRSEADRADDAGQPGRLQDRPRRSRLLIAPDPNGRFHRQSAAGSAPNSSGPPQRKPFLRPNSKP